MSRFLGFGLLVAVSLTTPGAASAQAPRTVQSILAEVESLGRLEFDRKRQTDPTYADEYRAALRAQSLKKSELLLEACRLAPQDPRVEDWMPQRWQILGWNQEPLVVADEILADIDKHLLEFSRPGTVREAGYYRALYHAHKLKPDAQKMYEKVTPFVTSNPQDIRGASLLQIVADSATGNDDLLRTIYRKQATDYPATHLGKYAAGRLRRIEEAGRPFELAFEDAITGKRVAVGDFLGKVVLVNFWATTCTPCIAETPRLKELYARLRSRGVEFIGVSMDAPESKGGLKALREFVSKRGLSWPQYYQGNGHDSDFSKSWGVGSTPTKFLLDREGRLVGVIANDEVESRLNALLEK